jgi:ATP-dependent HslUV protease ATP-binding subunit HslU
VAFEVNRTTQNIGARRLHTILERVIEDVSFDAPDRKGEVIRIDAAYVHGRLADVLRREDLTQFIL